MNIKTIFQGRLDFGTTKSFNQVKSMYEQRVTNFYRADVFIKEDAFDENSNALILPKFIAEGSKRTWENSIKVLQYLADFAVAGAVRAYITDRGEAQAREYIVANPERGSMKPYKLALETLKNEGAGEDVIGLLTEAIDKYDRHAQALETRATVWYTLGEIEKAFKDYADALLADPNLAEAYFHRAEMLCALGRHDEAVEDFTAAIKHSVPVRSLFWAARRLKGDCHAHLGDKKNALLEYRFFCSRQFEEGTENYREKHKTCLQYGKFLISDGKPEDALKVIDGILKQEQQETDVQISEILLLRGLALKRANKPGYVGALREAAKAGSTEAASMLNKAMA